MFNKGYAPQVNPNLVSIINPPPGYEFCIALELGTGIGNISLEPSEGIGCISLEIGSQ